MTLHVSKRTKATLQPRKRTAAETAFAKKAEPGKGRKDSPLRRHPIGTQIAMWQVGMNRTVLSCLTDQIAGYSPTSNLTREHSLPVKDVFCASRCLRKYLPKEFPRK